MIYLDTGCLLKLYYLARARDEEDGQDYDVISAELRVALGSVVVILSGRALPSALS